MFIFKNRKLAADTGTGSGSNTSTGEVASPSNSFDGYMSLNDNFDSELIGENHADVKPEAEKEVADPLKAGEEKSLKQDKNIDSAFAKMRKENEALAAKAKEIEDYNKWIADNFGEHGVTDLKSYKELMEKQLQEQKDAKLKEAGYDPEMIREAVKNDPELRKLFNITDKQETQVTDEAAIKAQQEEALVNDYKALAEEYPDLVTKPEDVPKEVWDLYDSRPELSLVEAYTLANRKTIISRNQEVGKQKALNNMNSKAHLKTESDGGNNGNDVQMSRETLQMYLDQGFSEKQAFAHYKKLYS